MTRRNQPVASADLRKNRILAALEPEDYEALMADAKVVSLKLERRIYKQDERIGAIYFPLTCMVSLLVGSEEEAVVEAATIGREGLVGVARLMLGQALIGLHINQLPGTAIRLDGNNAFTPGLCPRIQTRLMPFAIVPGAEPPAAQRRKSRTKRVRCSAASPIEGGLLAGAQGTRLRPLTKLISGDDTPKQFCPLPAGRTLLSHTRERIALDISPQRTLFFVVREQERFYTRELSDVSADKMIVQPDNRGTLPAILYSILQILTVDPEAVVAFLPSDHHYANEKNFVAGVELTFQSAERPIAGHLSCLRRPPHILKRIMAGFSRRRQLLTSLTTAFYE